jgi:hypothetical protein
MEKWTMNIGYLFILFMLALTGCERPERPDELQLMSDDVLKHHRGIRIDIEPGDAEKK